jgi:hypothetical protein
MADRYWVGGTATWDATVGTKWASTSGGAGGQSVPTSSDNVFFDAASSGVCTLSGTTACNCNNITFTGFTGTITHGAGIFLNVYGNLTLVAGMTYTPSSTARIVMKATSTGKTITSAGKSTSITFDGVGGGWTLQDAATVSNTWTLTNGALDTNDVAISMGTGTFTSTNSNVRTLDLGTSAITFTNGGLWDLTITTNLTHTVGSATFTSTSSTGNTVFRGGGLTYNSLSCVTLTSGGILMTGTNTFTDLTVKGLGNTSSMCITGLSLSDNITVTGTLTVGVVTPTGGRMFVQSSTINSPVTITAAAVAVDWCDFCDIVGAGAASWNLSAATGGSGDCGGNSGITFTTPADQYWVATSGTSTGAYSAATKWATSSGGTGGTGRSPLPQDTAIFDASSIDAGSRTITFDKVRYGSVNASAVTNTPQFAFNTQMNIYGDFILSNNITQSGASAFSFTPKGSVTFTPGTTTWIRSITVRSGTTTLGGPLTSTTSFTVSDGSFDSSSHLLTVTTLNSFGGTLTLGTGGASATSISISDGVVSSYGAVASSGTMAVTSTGVLNIYSSTWTAASSNTVSSGGTLNLIDGGEYTGTSGTITGNGAGGGATEHSFISIS